ncbi:MAG: non-homologous end-joining DNA ligase, partial [Verrucomicrobiota bacterium]
DKRLAVHVEDHPLDYANFEGTIPPGNYGAGTVMVWDMGTYEVGGGNPTQALEDGKLHLYLSGRKLNGEWTLIRLRSREPGEKENWLLLKSGADTRPISKRADDQSVLTKRSMKQIAAENTAQWQSNRTQRPKISRLVPLRQSRSVIPDADAFASLPKSKARFISPMKALLKEDLPKGNQWLYEIKFDGYRAIAVKSGEKIQLISRNGKPLDYPEITSAIENLPAREAVLDGEIVAVDEEGRSSFQLLQAYNVGLKKPPIIYYAFDLLHLEGKDLTSLPLTERKTVLEPLLVDLPEQVLFSASIEAESGRLLREMKARGLEGIIAKRRDSKYEPGRRSGAWVKFKWAKEQEFVIGGYTPPAGSRKFFGAILVGYYNKNQLHFASKVGTGFDARLLKGLYERFQKLKRPNPPFVNLPERRGRSGQGITASSMKRCTWLEPELVCQIRFTEWTRDGHLRHPVFQGLREDKDPREVVREEAQ